MKINWNDQDKINIIKQEVAKSPGNLKDAFQKAALRIPQTTYHGVKAAWYTKIKNTESVFATTSSRKNMSNSKNVNNRVKLPKVSNNAGLIHESVLSSETVAGIRIETVRRVFAAA